MDIGTDDVGLPASMRAQRPFDQKQHRTQKLMRRVYSWKSTRDKVMFMIGILNLAISGMLFSYHPKYLSYLYGLKFFTYFTWRCLTYRLKNYHYFLFDFCYFANAFNILLLFVFPDSETLFKICWCFTMGPLLWSVWMYHVSLVLHSIDKMTSVFIHFTPCATLAHWRTYQNGMLPSGRAMPVDMSLSVTDVWVYAFGSYCVWQILYATRVYWMGSRDGSLEQKPHILKYSLRRSEGFVYRWCMFFGPKWKGVMFVAGQFLFAVCTLALAPLFWQSPWTVRIALFCAIAVAGWNGASWYMEVFSLQYAQDAQRNKKRLEQLAEMINKKALMPKIRKAGKSGIDLDKLWDVWESTDGDTATTQLDGLIPTSPLKAVVEGMASTELLDGAVVACEVVPAKSPRPEHRPESSAQEVKDK